MRWLLSGFGLAALAVIYWAGRSFAPHRTGQGRGARHSRSLELRQGVHQPMARAVLPMPDLVPHLAPADLRPEWLALWFVPQHCTESGVVIGVEIEPRLQHPIHGLISPRDYRAMIDAEAQSRLTHKAFASALTALRGWDRHALGLDFLTLKLDQRQLMQENLADLLLWELDRQDVPPLRLVISVPDEVTFDGAPSHAISNIQRLAQAGCQIEAICSGNHDTSLPAGRPRIAAMRLRIGENIIAGCDSSARQQVMILAVLALAERLGMKAVAEAVGSAREHAYLAQIGITQVQGPGVARAVPADLMEGYLQECQHQSPAPIRLLRAG